MAKKLGYTWYPKDWRSSKRVFRLTLAERGFYRELLDEAYSTDNRVKVELDLWSREFGCGEEMLQEMLKKFEILHDSDGEPLIIIKKDILSIPSCEPRLNLSRGGRNGADKTNEKRVKKTEKNQPTIQPIVQPISQPNAQQREREREIKDNISISETDFIEIFKRAKKYYDKVESGVDKLLPMERQYFNNLIAEGKTKEDFEFAIAGLFFQGTLPTVRMRPEWVLKPENFSKMHDCWKTKTKIFEKKEVAQVKNLDHLKRTKF